MVGVWRDMVKLSMNMSTYMVVADNTTSPCIATLVGGGLLHACIQIAAQIEI